MDALDVPATFKKLLNQGFIRKVSPLAIPELIARLGIRWYAGSNKGQAASVVRTLVISDDIHGMASNYDALQQRCPTAETAAVARLLRSGQHATRQHREKIASIVQSLFHETTDADLNYVKETVFGVQNGAPIMAGDHPAILALFEQYDGSGLAVWFPSIDHF